MVTPKTQSIFEPGLHEPSPALLGGESQAPQNSAKILWVKENQNPNNNNKNPNETIDRGDPEENTDPRLREGSPRVMLSRGFAQQFVAARRVESEEISG